MRHEKQEREAYVAETFALKAHVQAKVLTIRYWDCPEIVKAMIDDVRQWNENNPNSLLFLGDHTGTWSIESREDIVSLKEFLYAATDTPSENGTILFAALDAEMEENGFIDLRKFKITI